MMLHALVDRNRPKLTGDRGEDAVSATLRHAVTIHTRHAADAPQLPLAAARHGMGTTAYQHCISRRQDPRA